MSSISGFDPSKVYRFDVTSDTLVHKADKGGSNQLENVSQSIVNLGKFYTQLKAQDSITAAKIQNLFLNAFVDLGNLHGALEEQVKQDEEKEEIQIASPTQTETPDDEEVSFSESLSSDRSSESPSIEEGMQEEQVGPDQDQIPENIPDFRRRETLIMTEEREGNIEQTERLHISPEEEI